MAAARLHVGMVLLLAVCATAGCVHSVRIDVVPETQPTAPSHADIQLAKKVVAKLAGEYGFEKHPNEDWYLSRADKKSGAKLEYRSAYLYTGSKRYGKIELFLAQSTEDGRLVALISDFDAYGRSEFVDSLEKALVASLAENFPADRVDVDSSRGVSPLGP